MVLCFAFGCAHRTGRDDCSFYRFPTDSKTHAQWSRAARRRDRQPGNDARLCSCHFIDGKKENGPSIFSYNENKKLDLSSPLRKRLKKSSTVEPESTEKQQEGMQCSSDKSIAVLRAENLFLAAEVERLENDLKTKSYRFLFSQIKENDSHVVMYTGLPNGRVFSLLLNYIQRLDFDYVYGWKVDVLSLEEQLFITLQKLRQNYAFLDLAVRYNVSDMTIRNVFYTLLSVIHESLFDTFMENHEIIPSLNKIRKVNVSNEFPNCRLLVDTTEIFIENPRADLEAQRQAYSHYKKRHTLKALLAVAPNGVICFCSKLYPGSTSDKELFKESGFIQILHPGDLILADKGFLIHDLLPKGVSVNIPPFLVNTQFTEEEARLTTKLARKRVHVERAIGRIKNFKILDCIHHHYQSSATVIFQVCAVLVNLQNPLLKVQ